MPKKDETSVKDLEVMAAMYDKDSAALHEILNDGGEYIRSRVNAVINHLPAMATYSSWISEAIIVLQRKRNTQLIVSLSDRNQPILEILNTTPRTPHAKRRNSITYNDAAVQFDKKVCGNSLRKALESAIKKQAAVIKKERAALKAAEKAFPLPN